MIVKSYLQSANARLTFMEADLLVSSSSECPVRMVTMPAVSSSPLLWDPVSWRQLSTILYRCLSTETIRVKTASAENPTGLHDCSQNHSASPTESEDDVAYQASISCRFNLSLSKLLPVSFWQRMYLLHNKWE